MGIHTLNLEDGSQVQVEAPKDTSLDELLLLANRQQRFQTPEPTKRRDEAIAGRLAETKATPIEEPVIAEEETGLLGDLASGFGAGFVGTGEMAALGAATLLGEENELAARKKIQSVADAIKPSGGDQDDLGYKIGSVFGSIAGFAAPIAGIAAGIAAAPVSLGAAATTGIATGAGALLGVGTTAGEASERARAAGATQEQRNRAIRQAAPFGLLEVAPLGRFMRSVDVPVIGKFIKDLGPETVENIGQKIQNAAITGGAEAAQEATAEIVQNLAERGYNPERAILEGTGESALLGGGAGATIQFFVDAFTNSRKAGPDGQPLAIEDMRDKRIEDQRQGLGSLQIEDQRVPQARAAIGEALDTDGAVPLEKMQSIVAETGIPFTELEGVVSEEMSKRGSALALRAKAELDAEEEAKNRLQIEGPESQGLTFDDDGNIRTREQRNIEAEAGRVKAKEDEDARMEAQIGRAHV